MRRDNKNIVLTDEDLQLLEEFNEVDLFVVINDLTKDSFNKYNEDF